MKTIIIFTTSLITLFSVSAFSADVCRVEREGLSQNQYAGASVGVISMLNIDDNLQNSISCSDTILQGELRRLYKSSAGSNNDGTVTVIKKLVELGYEVKTETLFVKK